jgi:hypothetical protein
LARVWDPTLYMVRSHVCVRAYGKSTLSFRGMEGISIDAVLKFFARFPVQSGNWLSIDYFTICVLFLVRVWD